jgi:hypothetical protein
LNGRGERRFRPILISRFLDAEHDTRMGLRKRSPAASFTVSSAPMNLYSAMLFPNLIVNEADGIELACVIYTSASKLCYTSLGKKQAAKQSYLQQ